MISEITRNLPQIYGYINHSCNNGIEFNFHAGNLNICLPIDLRGNSLVSEILSSKPNISGDRGGMPPIIYAINNSETDAVILLPVHPEEYMKAMRLRHYLDRHFNGRFKVAICHPGLMGAYWQGVCLGDVSDHTFTLVLAMIIQAMILMESAMFTRQWRQVSNRHFHIRNGWQMPRKLLAVLS